MSELREQLAAIEHERWADWQQWMHNQCILNDDGSLTIPEHLVRRWQVQIQTLYEHLSEEEKESDREQVDRYLHLVVDVEQAKRIATAAMFGAEVIENIPYFNGVLAATAYERFDQFWMTQLKAADLTFMRQAIGLPEPEKKDGE